MQENTFDTKGNVFIGKNAGDFRSCDWTIKCPHFYKHTAFCDIFTKIQVFGWLNRTIVIARDIFF